MHECVVVIETEGSIKAGLQIKYEFHPKILKVAIQNMKMDFIRATGKAGNGKQDGNENGKWERETKICVKLLGQR